MNHATNRGRLHLGAWLLAALLLAPAGIDTTAAPSPVTAGDTARADLLCWRSCGGKAKSLKRPKSRKLPKEKSLRKLLDRLERMRKHAEKGNRGQANGLQASSNPTSVPIIDTDFKFSVFFTDMHLRTYEAHQLSRGDGVVVAVLDGGFNLDHPDLAGRLHPMSYDAIDDDFDAHDEGNGLDDDLDGYTDGSMGHGTFVSGVIARTAPGAEILPIRVRDDEGWGTNMEMERGLLMAYMLGAQVINISGESTHGRSQFISDMIHGFRAQGILVVNSAGNDYSTEEVSEVGYTGDTLIVGATDTWGRLADFSNVPLWQPAQYVLAPGVDVYGPLGIGQDDTRGYWNGTSFSTAYVSAAAALLKAVRPELPADEALQRLMHATDPAWTADGQLLPYGRINLWKVVSQ